MSNYRRARAAGGCYFFTAITHGRREVLVIPEHLAVLRAVVTQVRADLPFVIEAWVVLPDHMHCIWTLPAGDHDFSKRWGLIKAGFTKRMVTGVGWAPPTISRMRHREGTVWQRRFWEHQIRDEDDFQVHADYIHYNPVKHGLVARVRDWPHSTFHRYVRNGLYAEDWGGVPTLPMATSFGE